MKIIYFMMLCLSFNAFATKSTGDVIKADDYNSSVLNIGAIQNSFLSESSFKKLNGNCWTLLDGKPILGSDYARFLTNEGRPAIIPDARGLFMRGHNNGRNDGKQNPDNTALGEYQADAYGQHRHTEGQMRARDYAYTWQSIYGYLDRGGSYTIPTQASGAYAGASPYTSTAGGNETRSKSMTVNYFIKINKICTFPQ